MRAHIFWPDSLSSRPFFFFFCYLFFRRRRIFHIVLIKLRLVKGQASRIERERARPLARAHSVQHTANSTIIIPKTNGRNCETARKICASNAYAGLSAKSIFFFFFSFRSFRIRMQAEYLCVGYFYYWSVVAATAAAALFFGFTQKSYILYKSIHNTEKKRRKKTLQNNLHTIARALFFLLLLLLLLFVLFSVGWCLPCLSRNNAEYILLLASFVAA